MDLLPIDIWKSVTLKIGTLLSAVGDTIIVSDTNTICVLMHSYGRTDYCVCVWHVNEMLLITGCDERVKRMFYSTRVVVR